MKPKKKIDALIIHKPATLFPQWDEKLASMHEHLEALNTATGKDFKEFPIDEETIVMAVVTDIIDSRQAGVMEALSADAEYVFESMLNYFVAQYLIPDTTESSVVELIKNHLHGLTKHYTEMYTMLIERLSRVPLALGEHLCPDDWALEIREADNTYVLTVTGSSPIDVTVSVF